MAKNKKMTRNSYKRKIIVLGIMIFMSIALVSTGFAAWVISRDAKVENEGNISIGVVQSETMTVTINEADNHSFAFEPLEEDTTGRVRNDGTNFERMSFKFTGTVTNTGYLKSDTTGKYVKIKLDLTGAPGIKAAAEAGYIVLPECADTWVNVYVDNDEETNEATFEYTVEFEWGTAFGGMNPSKYYDEHADGLAVDDLDVEEELDEFRRIMYNVAVEDYDPAVDYSTGANAVNYTVIVLAEVN